jgi:hypothetical protein
MSSVDKELQKPGFDMKKMHSLQHAAVDDREHTMATV